MNKKTIAIICALLVVIIAVGAIIIPNLFKKVAHTPAAPEKEQVDAPEIPLNPDEPSVPETPDEPSVPEEPTTPDNVETPNEPPVNPDPPSEPETPAEPTPEVPSEPETPAEPTPEVPSEPTTPVEPTPTPEPSTPHTHKWDDVTVIRKESCDCTGKYLYTCACGATKTVTTDRNPDDHDYVAGANNGITIVYTCSRCTKQKIVNICKHVWTEWMLIQPGSCVDGYNLRRCTICYTEERTVNPAVGYCVYEVIGEFKNSRLFWCVGCYETKEESLPDGNPNYKPTPTRPSTPSNLYNW